MQKLAILFFLILSQTLMAQNVGIGTNTPLARLHLTDSSVLFSATGDIPATPGNTPISGTGRRMMWYADKAAFRAGFAAGTDWDINNIGNYSFASGNRTIASGNNSTAMGQLTTASGVFSTSMGGNTIASNGYATAMGYASVASGMASIATGFSTTAKAFGSFSTGHFNDISDNPAPSTPFPTNRIFQIGNGNSEATRSNAMTVLQNGNAGIGVTTPLAKLHVADSSVLFSATGLASETPGDPPVSGAGRRMMWYADKAAFRAGYVTGTEWDINNIGKYSFASGYRTTASGDYSAALGQITTASGAYSTAMGANTFASGFVSTAMGEATNATGDYSTAMGSRTTAKAFGSLSIGVNNDISDNPNPIISSATDRIFQIGNGINASTRSNAVTVLKNGNTGIGTANPLAPFHVNGVSFFSPGGSNIQILDGNRIQAYINDGLNLTTYSDDPIKFTTFTNGGSGSERMRILSNGNVGIGTSAPGFLLEVNGSAGKPGGGSWSATSDARLKDNVIAYTDGLSTLLRINPVKYHYNQLSGYDTNPEYVGVLAQDIKSIAPYMVGWYQKKGESYYNVDNSAMTYMLINAVKEQQQQIDELKKLVEKLLKQ